MAVNIFFEIAAVKSMCLVNASLKLIELPVGNGVLGILPLNALFLLNTKVVSRLSWNISANF